MGVSPKELTKREFECIQCSHRVKIEVKRATRAIRNLHCVHCGGTRQYFATDTLKRINKEKEE